ncbi:MAG: histidine kinase [Chloroflexi bacterium]|nr:histidine kinase [Chloroflexota bacterium]
MTRRRDAGGNAVLVAGGNAGPRLDDARMTTTAHARPLAWALAALALALALGGLALFAIVQATGVMQHQPTLHMAFTLIFGGVSTAVYAVLGALVAARQPRNPIGWLLCAVAVLFGLTSLTVTARLVGESSQVMLPAFDIARWLDLWIWVPATIVPLTFLLLYFPDGRLPSARWGLIAWAAGLGIVAFVLSVALHPRPPIEPIPPVNPYGVAGIEGALEGLYTVAMVLVPLGVFGALAALIVRLRRARGIEREQLKWLAYAAVLSVASLVVISLWSALRPGDLIAYELYISGVWVALTLIGIGAGIAILRHHLYDIDLLINRTLVYGALTAGVVCLYVLLVGSLGALFQSSGNLTIALVATGLAAVLFQPLRAWLQRGVNRLMYGERDDPYTVLSRLSQQLTSTLAPSAVLPSITEAVAQALKLPYVALALSRGGGLEVAAAYGQPASEPLRLPLIYQAETVGQLVVAPRAPGEAFTPAERRLLEDIAVHAGVAAHAVRLADDLQRSRERLVTAREEERRRLRRDLHDGLGPQLASLTLTIAAARELLRHDPAAADRLLHELTTHTQTAITDIRRVIYDLRPPALDDLGLAPALREQAARIGQGGLCVTIDAPDRLPPLPAAVEVAAYRIALEALTNIVRHARASTATVRLTLDGDALGLTIRDDGVGMASGGRTGVGLASMRERAAELGGTWAIDSAPGRGVHIEVRLPLRQEIA